MVHDGNQIQRYQYDAAGRLANVKTDNNTLIASYTYGASNQRLITTEGNLQTYYAWSGEATVAEYTEVNSSGAVTWSKSYVYLGARLLATLQPNGSGAEFTQFHHPDRLGTRLITNASDATYQEQVSLPYGTALDAESTGASNRRFTSYDRSATTGLDYAVNRHYDSQQGRFTQVDPIGMSAASLSNPQSLNLYAYCGNDPINHTDPNGLFWGKLKHVLKKALRIFNAVVLTVVAILAPTPQTISAASNAWIDAFGGPRLRRIANAINNVIQSFGVRVSIGGARTTPPWNPNTHPSLIFAFQGQQGTSCPPDCQDVIFLPPVSAGDIYANYSRWERIWRAVSNWATGVADQLTTIPLLNWSLTRWYRHWRGWEGDADEDSTAYKVGIGTGFGFQVLIPGRTIFRPFTGSTQTITHWGTEADIASGSWVMTGGGSVRNWLFSGTIFRYAYRFRITITVPKSTLSYPSGFEWFKGLFGQRIYRP